MKAAAEIVVNIFIPVKARSESKLQALRELWKGRGWAAERAAPACVWQARGLLPAAMQNAKCGSQFQCLVCRAFASLPLPVQIVCVSPGGLLTCGSGRPLWNDIVPGGQRCCGQICQGIRVNALQGVPELPCSVSRSSLFLVKPLQRGRE